MEENIIHLYSITIPFTFFLILAAVLDVWKFIIPNFVSIGIFVLFFVATLLVPFQTHWLSHLGTAGATFVVGLIVYRFRLLGAGDVKLITAVSLWSGVENISFFLLYTALAGGALSLGLVLLRYVILAVQYQSSHPGFASIPRILRYGESVPYGLAVAVGGFSVMLQLPHLLLRT